MQKAKLYRNENEAKKAAIELYNNDESKYEIIEFGNKFAVIEKKQKATIKILHKSTVERPCALVWALAADMLGASRVAVVNACISAGIATHTAKTQYQQWFRANKADELAAIKAAAKPANDKKPAANEKQPMAA